jgi:hypothetical protein
MWDKLEDYNITSTIDKLLVLLSIQQFKIMEEPNWYTCCSALDFTSQKASNFEELIMAGYTGFQALMFCELSSGAKG